MAVRFSNSGQSYTRTLTLGTQAALTVCGWFKLSVDRNNYSSIFFIDNGTSDNWGMQTGVDGTTMATVFDASTQQGIGSMTVGTWYFICLSTSGTTGNIYYRTAAQSTLTTVAVTSVTASVNAATLRIGESPWGGEWLNGVAAAVKGWNVALSANEALQESFQYIPQRISNLLFEHPFVKAETADYSGNGRTLSGGTGTATEDGPPIPWQASVPRIILPAAASSTPKSASDSLTEVDSSNLTAAGSVTDSVGLSDSSSLSAADSATDAATLTESTTIALASSDSFTLADSAAMAASTARVDAASVGDASSAGAAVGVVDAAAVADSSSLDAGATPKTANDSATAADTAAASVASPAADSASAADASALTVQLSASDSAAFGDSKTLAVALSGVDALAVADQAAITAALSRVDTVSVSDSGTLGGAEFFVCQDLAGSATPEAYAGSASILAYGGSSFVVSYGGTAVVESYGGDATNCGR